MPDGDLIDVEPAIGVHNAVEWVIEAERPVSATHRVEEILDDLRFGRADCRVRHLEAA